MPLRVAAWLSLLLLLAGCAVDVAPPRPGGRAGAVCRALARRLPDKVGDEKSRATDPDSPFTAAWGDPAITLRCGVRKPKAYVPTAQLLTVNDIAWLPVPQDADVPTTFYVVERRAYVEVVVPKEHSPASDALVDLGKPLSATDPRDPTSKP